ncbi:MAG: cytochrome c oxidase subunit II [Alphaproteobacteria bacterium]|nr:cytochrome c oxidase subunit II [Alphaproteobacteria bacterium]
MQFAKRSSFAIALIGATVAVPPGALADKPRPWQMGFQDAASPIMEQIGAFHNIMLVVITLIVLFVLGLLVYVMIRFKAARNPTPSKVTHNTVVEVLWTVVPVIVLVLIAIPSFKLLYAQKVIPEAEMTVKAIGLQWYWTYEYQDYGDLTFDAIMIPDEDIQEGQLRLLETDNRLVLPVQTNIRILVTAADVLHAWAIPAFGIKIDAVPGRINETWVRIEREGVYYGQCSELCGIYHGFMPITVEAVSKEAFAEWVEKAKAEFAEEPAPAPVRVVSAGAPTVD